MVDPVVSPTSPTPLPTHFDAPSMDAHRAGRGAASPLHGRPFASTREERTEKRVVDLPGALAPPGHDRTYAPGPKRLLQRHPIMTGVGVLAVLAFAAFGYLYLDYAGHFETTDDAFVAARQFSIAPKVTGYITAVPVTDNQHVEARDVIARIDDRDYRIALAQAEAQVAASQAGIRNIDAQIDVQQSQIGASQAQVAQAQAGLVFAQQQAARYEDLLKTGAGTVQNAQQYSSQLRQQQAVLDSAQATLKVTQRQLESLKAQRESAVASLAQSEAQRDQAQLNLSYTVIRAAQAGRIVNLSGAVGQLAQPGTALTMFVPDEVWVTANFKETQLDRMRPGEPATLRIDAYPSRRNLRGVVDSVQPGSGTAFSLLPAENATGNYVKIVQRVPVKIAMDNAPADIALGPGMSVVPTIRVDPAPALIERLEAWL